MYHLPDPITVSVSSTRIMIAYVDGEWYAYHDTRSRYAVMIRPVPCHVGFCPIIKGDTDTDVGQSGRVIRSLIKALPPSLYLFLNNSVCHHRLCFGFKVRILWMTIKQAHEIAKFSYTSTNCDDMFDREQKLN